MDLSNFGWAIIGCGKIAEKAAKSIKEIGAGKVVAVWNRTPSRAEKFSSKHGGRVCSTAEEAISFDGVNCVYVATTHDRHAFYSALAISSGVPVLCEKPLTVNARETEELIYLARSKGVYLAEAMWTRHNPVTLKVLEWAKSIGKIERVRATFGFPMLLINKNPRLIKKELCGGVLMDLGVYPIRYVCELFGAPKSIDCSAALLNGVDSDDEIVMDYSDFKAEIRISMKKFVGEKVTVEGEGGKITVPYFHMAKKAMFRGAKGEKFSCADCLFGLTFKHTAEDILSGKKESGYCPLDKTLETMRLLDECRSKVGVKYPCEE